ncbi:MAG: cytochrome c3 family protein [Acidobacteriota bacterium]
MSNTRSLLLITISVLVLLPATLPGAEDDPAEFSHSLIQQAEKTWVVLIEDGAQPIEDLTAYCIACHSDLEENGKGRTHGPSSGVHSHPVDQPYPATGADLVPLKELDKRLLLVDGAITCITCHDHNATDRELVIPDASGELCISCHRK